MVRYLPIVLIQIYLSFTLLLYTFGPLKWDTQNVLSTYCYLLLYQLSLGFGYIYGIKKVSKILPVEKHINTLKIEDLFLKNLWIILLFSFLFLCISYRNIIMVNNVSEYNLFKEFFIGLSDPGTQYVKKLLHMQTYQGGKIVTIISGIISIFHFSLVPICTLLWERISKLYKVSFLVLCFLEVSIYVSIGTNKGIVNLMLLLLLSLLMILVINYSNEKFYSLKNKKTLIILMVCMIFFSCWFFNLNMKTRVGEYGNNIQTYLTMNEIQLNDSFREKKFSYPIPRYGYLILNQNQIHFFESLSIYLCSGYFIFSLALSEPFETTYGVGNSVFLYSNVSKILNVDLEERLYATKVNNKIRNVFFTTAYLDFANDIHFIGVIFLLFIIGLFTALIWSDFYIFRNPFAFILLHFICIQCLYIPAFNQLFMGAYMFFAFFESLILWLFFTFIRK